MSQEQPILVAIWCLVYNHEPYLRDCLEGFVMQKTNFRFVAIVHEDASKDNSAIIIREYAEKYPYIIHPIYETENQWSKHDGSLDRIMSDAIAATGANYIAMCEGDDYWTDPYKLQKQVDILEADENVGLCFSRMSILNQSTGVVDMNAMKADILWDFEALLLHEPQITASVIYRRSLYDEYVKEIAPEIRNGQLMGDTQLWLYLAAKSKVAFLPDITSTYRVLALSASHTGNLQKRIAFNQSARRIRLYFCNKYFPERKDWIAAVEDKYYRMNMYDAISYNDKICALKSWMKIKEKSEEDNRIIDAYISTFNRPIRRVLRMWRRVMS